MDAEVLLQEISTYCRSAGLAESTFGRLAINDGKLVNRLRYGGRITTVTLDRIRSFMANSGRVRGGQIAGSPVPLLPPADAGGSAVAGAIGNTANFRFYDNRQKYLLFVNTCSEKSVIAQRVAMEIANVHPRPPAVRLFDAGVGDGTVLARMMRALHHRFPTMPHYLVGKEISLENIRLTLDKMPDRFYEHPPTVLVMTNLYYPEAPWLTPSTVAGATSLVWHEVPLRGTTAHDFEQQITEQQNFLAEHWGTRMGAGGTQLYERPVVMVIYREDQRFLLDAVIPRRGAGRADYDLVIASHPYRSRASAEFKARKVTAPLARGLGPGGRLLAIHGHGDDPGMEIVQKVWPGENPFPTDRHELLRVAKAELGNAARDLNFNAYADNRSLFRYEMHTLPSEVGDTVGTSTLFAAWNAAVYVAQIEDQRLGAVIGDRGYLDATREVLQKHGGLWFNDESFVISRKRD